MKYRNSEYHLSRSCCNSVCCYDEAKNVGW